MSQNNSFSSDWKLFYNEKGAPFYYNTTTGESSLVSSPTPTPRGNTPNQSIENANVVLVLPEGWEEAEDPKGRKYFIDHNTKTTSWVHPMKKQIEQQQQQQQQQQTTPLAAPSPSHSIGIPQSQSNHSFGMGLAQSMSPNSSGSFMKTISPTGSFVGSPPTEYHDFLTGSNRSVSPVLNHPQAYSSQPHNPQKLSLCAPTWRLPNDLVACSLCGNALASLFKRKSTCVCCSLLFCSSCCSKTLKGVGKCCEECWRHNAAENKECINRVYPCLLDPRENLQRAAAMELLDLVLGQPTNSKILCEHKLFLTTMHQILMGQNEYLSLMVCKIGAQLSLVAENVPIFVGDTAIMEQFSRLLLLRDRDLLPEIIQLFASLSGEEQFVLSLQGVTVLSTSISMLDASSWENIALILCRFTENPENLSAFDQIPAATSPLLSLLSSESRLILEPSLYVIHRLCKTCHKQTLYEAGGLIILLDLLNKLCVINSDQFDISVDLILSCFTEYILLDGSTQGYCEIFVSSNGVGTLLQLLGSSNAGRATKIMSLLYKLVSFPSLSKSVIHELLGGLRVILDLLSTDKPELLDFCLCLLLAMCSNENIHVLVRESGGIPRIVSMLSSSDETHQEKAIRIIGRMIQDDEQNVVAVLSANGILPIINYLSSAHLVVQNAAIHTLVTFTKFPQIYSAILAVGGLPALMNLLEVSREPIKEQALVCLVHLGSDKICLESIFSYGNVLFLIPFLCSRVPNVRKLALLLFVSFAQHPNIKPAIHHNSCIGILTNLLGDEMVEIQELAGLGIVTMANASAECRDIVVQSVALPGIIQLLCSNNPAVVLGASELLLHITKTEYGRKLLASLGIITFLFSVLDNEATLSDPQTALHIVHILSAIVTEPNQLQMIMQERGIPRLVNLLAVGSEPTQVGATAVLSSIATVKEACDTIIESGALPLLFNILKETETENDLLIEQSMRTLTNLSYSDHAAAYMNTEEQVKILLYRAGSGLRGVADSAVSIIQNISLEPSTWRMIISMGGIPLLLRLAGSGNAKAQIRAATELGLLTNDEESRSLVMKYNGLKPLLEVVLLSPNHEVQESGLHAIANLSGIPITQSAIIERGSISPIASFLSPQDSPASQLHSATILANISSQPDHVSAIGEADVISRLTEIIQSSNENTESILLESVVRTLSNLILEEKNARDLFDDYQSLEGFLKLVFSTDSSVVLSVAYAIHHIAKDEEISLSLISDPNLTVVMRALFTLEHKELHRVAGKILVLLTQRGSRPFESLIPAILQAATTYANDKEMLDDLIKSLLHMSRLSSMRDKVITGGVLHFLCSHLIQHLNEPMLALVALLALEEKTLMICKEDPTFFLKGIENLSKLSGNSLHSQMLFLKRCCLCESLRAQAEERNFVPKLLALLGTSSADFIHEQVFDTLEILMIDASCRKALDDANGYAVIYSILNHSISERILLRIAALFHNLTFDGTCSSGLRESGVISFFIEQLQLGNEAMTISCLYALNNLLCSENEKKVAEHQKGEEVAKELSCLPTNQELAVFVRFSLLFAFDMNGAPEIQKDTLVFTPVLTRTGSSMHMIGKEKNKFAKRLPKTSLHTADSENLASMLRTDRAVKMRRTSSVFDLSYQDQALITNGAKPDGFSAEDYKVKCGTLQALFNHLCSDGDVEFRKMFLLTYRSFSSSEELLDALQQRYAKYGESVAAAAKIIGTLKAWIRDHWNYDFSGNEELTAKLEQFIAETSSMWSKQLRTAVNKVATPTQQTAQNFPPSFPPTKPLHAKFVNHFADISPVEVARQIAIHNFRLFQKIEPSELLNQSWCGKRKEENAPNLLCAIAFFNTLSGWAKQNVVMHTTVDQRVTALRWVIDLASELITLEDISSTVAILSGLQATEVERLKKTWKKIGSKWSSEWKRMVNLTSSSSNYQMMRILTAKCEPPMVPFIGFYLKDLTFIEEGNNSYLDNGLINMDKCYMVSNVIQSIQQNQEIGYHLHYQEISEFQDWIASFELVCSSMLYDRSLLLEPRKDGWDAYEQLLLAYDERSTEERPNVPTVNDPIVEELGSSDASVPSPLPAKKDRKRLRETFRL